MWCKSWLCKHDIERCVWCRSWLCKRDIERCVWHRSWLCKHDIERCVVQTLVVLTRLHRGRVDDLSFFEYLSSFCFLSIEFHCTFSIFFKYYHILFIILVFRLCCDCLLFLLLSFPRDQSRDVTPRLGEGG